MNACTLKDKDLIKYLKEIAGTENVLSAKEELYAYSYDATNITEHKGIADAIVFVENCKQVSDILKYANQHKIPVVPRCAGTNHVGGCIPKQGGIIISFARMNNIPEINTENLYAVVEPGVVVGDLQKAVEGKGLFYPPDPSNLAVSMIGGSIALSSGGPRTFKYGTTKDYVIDLEVVLADGTIITTGSKCAKNVTGYNLTQLFVGSEGTLGIVTKAVIKLIPKPETKKVMLVYFNEFEDALKSVSAIISNLITPSVIDFLDNNTICTIEKFFPSGLMTDKQAALLIEIDGNTNSLDRQYEKIISLCNLNNAAYIQTAQNEQEAEKIWTARRASFGAAARLAPVVVTEDVVVPRENISRLVKGIREICNKYSLKACIMGHIGDGNIHPNIALNPENYTELQNYLKYKDNLFELAVSLGGTLSGEHGIGCEKSSYLSSAMPEETLNCMKMLKKLFDPENILNPGKIF